MSAPTQLGLREAFREARRIVEESIALASPRRDSLGRAVRELYSVFPRREWLVRALARYLLGTVEEQSRSVWLVRGIPELGDKKPFYLVTQAGDRYECSCYRTPHGVARRRSICTHVAAVIIYKKRKRYIDEYV